KASAKQDISDLTTEIQMLEAGEALITSPTTPFAIPVKVHLYEDWVRTKEKNEKVTVKIDEEFFG
ncbi:MAG TPA: hypothetical protein VJ165_00680, partial [candidate division Zixibacteria bacterium]|nr:hypothetical protein [candidate division Zixibacteria bacterium]